jgi:hypothetical protein
MRIQMLTKWSPAKGKMLQAGQVVDDVPDEVAADLIERGLARPVKTQAERAVGPGQVTHG